MRLKSVIAFAAAVTTVAIITSCNSTSKLVVKAEPATVAHPTLTTLPHLDTIPGIQAKIVLNPRCSFKVEIENTSAQDEVITILTDSGETSEIAATTMTRTTLWPRFSKQPNSVELITSQGDIMLFMVPRYNRCQQPFAPLNPSIADVGDAQTVEQIGAPS